MGKSASLPLEGKCVVEMWAQKHGHVYEALPLEGKCKCGMMPQQSLCEGALAALKAIAPGDLEGDLPWDPGEEENVKHKVNTPLQGQHSVWHRGACITGQVVWLQGAWVGSGPGESVKEHQNEATTYLYPYSFLPSYYRGVDPFWLEAHQTGQRPLVEGGRKMNKTAVWPFESHHTCDKHSHAHLCSFSCSHHFPSPNFPHLYLWPPSLSTMSTPSYSQRPLFTSTGNCNLLPC